MSNGKQRLDEPHKCLTAKCKGHLSPHYTFGEWAYWHPAAGRWQPEPPPGMTHDEVPLDKTPLHQ